MRTSSAVVVAGTMAFALAGCTAKPGPDARTPPSAEPASEAATEPTVRDESPPSAGIALPSLDGLELTQVGPPDDGPADAEKWLRKITVDCPAEGEPRVADVHTASRWRGIALPRDEGPRVLPVAHRQPEVQELRVKVCWINSRGQVIFSDKQPFPDDWPGVKVPLSITGARVRVRVNKLDIPWMPDGALDFAELARVLGCVDAEHRMPVIIDAMSGVPWRHVMGAMAACLRAGRADIRFQAAWGHDARAAAALVPDGLVKRLMAEAKRSGTCPDNLPKACARIRADGAATWSSVRGVVTAAMRAYVWRLSFVGMLGGREVEIGPVYDRPDDPPTRPPSLAPAPDPGPPEKSELFEREREIDLPADIEHPVFIHDEVDEVVETPVDAEDEIMDVPLGGTGVVGGLASGGGGDPGIGYFRTGGRRRRAAIRGGGSRASESAVDAAHAWLARDQEPDGRWSSARHGGAEGLDVAATGLATLSLLGAGNTETQGRYAETVRKAVAWLVSNQDEDGCLADDAAKRAGRAGTSHSIAGLTLAEAFGMARVAKTGRAAQEAVDYSVGVHQPPYSGWGEEPKGDPDTLVTGWFIAQLKSAKIAGFKVDGRGFQGSIAWLDKVTDFPDKAAGRPGGAARIRPREAPSPTATAIATFALQVMGWKRDDARVVGGSDFVLAHLQGSDVRKLDREFLYWGALAMFQMGNERWKTWNRRVRDMLISTQREGTGDAALDGSWDPVAADADLGRAGATALASMCLEVYYRYLPVYKESGRTR